MSFVGIRFDPERIAEPITQVPGRRCGASPPDTPKLIIPGQLPKSVRASAIAAASVAVKLRPLPPQMTCLPGPAAMRASNASPTTMIKSPPAPHFADQNHTTVPRTTSKLLPLAAPTHHDQLFPFGRSHAQPRWPQRLRTSPSFRIVLANLSRSSRKSLVRGLARLLTLGSGNKL